MKKLLAILLVTLTLLSLVACGGSKKWPEGDLPDMILAPKASKINVLVNDETLYLADAYGISAEYFAEYIVFCGEDGFVLDVTQTEDSFVAYHSNGAYLNLCHIPTESRMTIEILSREGDETWTRLDALAEKVAGLDPKMNEIADVMDDYINSDGGETSTRHYFELFAALLDKEHSIAGISVELQACVTEVEALTALVKSTAQSEALSACSAKVSSASEVFSSLQTNLNNAKENALGYFENADSALDYFNNGIDEASVLLDATKADLDKANATFQNNLNIAKYPYTPDNKMNDLMEALADGRADFSALSYRLNECKNILDGLEPRNEDDRERLDYMMSRVNSYQSTIDTVNVKLNGIEETLNEYFEKVLSSTKTTTSK